MILKEKGRAATRRAASRAVIAMLLSTALATCGGGADTAGVTPDGRGGAWNVVISPTTLTVVQGQTATATVSIVGNPKGSVPLQLLGTAPDSITETLSPQVLSNSSSTSTLTIRAALKASIGNLSVFVRGVDGKDTSVVSLALTVAAAPSVTVEKQGSGSGTVTSDPAGMNCGNACVVQFPVGTSVTLSATQAAGSVFAGWTGACIGTALTCTFIPATNSANRVIATFNSTTPAIALSVFPSLLSVQQGTSATATVTVTRVNGYASPVALTTSAPAGLTVSANPTSVTGTTSTLSVSAPASLAVGNYPVTITATGSGVTQQTVTLPVQVAPASQGAAITFNFADCETSDTPVWLAVQSGTGPWTRVTPANNAFTFTPGATGGLAFVTLDGQNATTEVWYASAAELTSLALAGSCTYIAPTGTKRISGTLAGAGFMSQGYTAQIVVGGAEFLRTSDFDQSFTMNDVPKGPRDLIASRYLNSPSVQIPTAAANNRMILRRSTNYANGATIPRLDLGSAEAFAPVIGSVMVSSFSDTMSLTASLITSNGSSAPYHSSKGPPGPGGGARALFSGVPDSLLQPGDFHAIEVFTSSGSSFRLIQMLEHSVTAKTTAFGPSLGTGTKITTLGTTPYLRLRAQVPTVNTYTSAADLELSQNANNVSVFMTAAYLGSAPTTWTLDVPDFSSAGYDATWGIKNGVGVSWNVVAASALNGNLVPFIGGTPVDNAQLTAAGVADSSSSFSASRRLSIIRRPRRY